MTMDYETKKSSQEAFTGIVTLNDIKGRGVKEILVIVTTPGETGEKDEKYILTSAEPTKLKECGPDEEVHVAAYMSRSAQPGQPYWEDGCLWVPCSSQTHGGDWIEAFEVCLGGEHCAHTFTVRRR